MNCGIVFSQAEDDRDNTVLLVPVTYLTSHATLLVFIPIGPKDAAGYPTLKKISDHIRTALSSLGAGSHHALATPALAVARACSSARDH